MHMHVQAGSNRVLLAKSSIWGVVSYVLRWVRECVCGIERGVLMCCACIVSAWWVRGGCVVRVLVSERRALGSTRSGKVPCSHLQLRSHSLPQRNYKVVAARQLHAGDHKGRHSSR